MSDDHSADGARSQLNGQIRSAVRDRASAAGRDLNPDALAKWAKMTRDLPTVLLPSVVIGVRTVPLQDPGGRNRSWPDFMNYVLKPLSDERIADSNEGVVSTMLADQIGHGIREGLPWDKAVGGALTTIEAVLA